MITVVEFASVKTEKKMRTAVNAKRFLIVEKRYILFTLFYLFIEQSGMILTIL
jgi:hypothetical protein